MVEGTFPLHPLIEEVMVMNTQGKLVTTLFSEAIQCPHHPGLR